MLRTEGCHFIVQLQLPHPMDSINTIHAHPLVVPNTRWGRGRGSLEHFHNMHDIFVFTT